ncbi:MAG: ATP-binding protein [Rhodocyclaceae bacterium]|nr:ATP-binding protein [Rhodocyclaceae bacterium]
MGRLFWKIFAFLWAAQFLTSLGVGMAIWSLRPQQALPPLPPPPPPFHVDQHRPPPPYGPRPERRFPFLPPPEPLIGGLLVSLLSAAGIAWYLSRPIRSLRQALEATATGKLETRVGPAMGTRRDEFADLGSAFDGMAERLEALIGTQRRLLHDVSHELRSPLARLQAAVGLLRQQPARSEELIERIERDTTRMDRLVGELLTLARIEAGTDTGGDEQGEYIELVALIGAVVADARFEAESSGCRFSVTAPASCLVRGNGGLLQRAVENVVRNALQHSPAGGEIEIALQTSLSTGDVLLRVTDHGPGIAEEERERIFDAFVRGTGGGAGYGLGLAITRRIVEMHGGTAKAANRTGGGLQMTLTLPVDGAAASKKLSVLRE